MPTLTLILQVGHYQNQILYKYMSKKETTPKPTEKVKVIKTQDEKALIDFINNLPTKYGLPLLKFIDGLETKEL